MSISHYFSAWWWNGRNVDTDGDGLIDVIDNDDDNDGIVDKVRYLLETFLRIIMLDWFEDQ